MKKLYIKIRPFLFLPRIADGPLDNNKGYVRAKRYNK